MKKIAKILGINFTITKDEGTIRRFTLWNKELAKFLHHFGRSKAKFIPKELKQLEPRFLKIFLETLLKGDGWPHRKQRGNYRYYTISKQLADDIQEIALKLGLSANISRKDDGYQVNICRTKAVHTNHSGVKGKENQNDGFVNYNGYVYCVHVKGDGIVLVRRNGKPVWSGQTLGEYGTPNIDIPEGFFEIEYRGRKDTLPFPKQAGSWYHWTKVHDSNNIMFACKIWKLKSTDLNQGPVYGTRIDKIKEDWQRTRYDFDHVFGTVINRYVAQAVIGYPLTPYGGGGQTRGFININDTMQAIELCIKNPPALGEYRVFNQFYELFTVFQLATIIKEIADQYGLDVKIKPIENPRVEAEEHYYNPSNENLFKLGWKPRGIRQILPQSIEDLIKFKDRIEAKRDFIKPTIRWR